MIHKGARPVGHTVSVRLMPVIYKMMLKIIIIKELDFHQLYVSSSHLPEISHDDEVLQSAVALWDVPVMDFSMYPQLLQ